MCRTRYGQLFAKGHLERVDQIHADNFLRKSLLLSENFFIQIYELHEKHKKYFLSIPKPTHEMLMPVSVQRVRSRVFIMTITILTLFYFICSVKIRFTHQKIPRSLCAGKMKKRKRAQKSERRKLLNRKFAQKTSFVYFLRGKKRFF